MRFSGFITGREVVSEGTEDVKYKNIRSAIHNFGHSFVSLMNYVDGVYVIDELFDIRAQEHDIEIDWLKNTFAPESKVTPPIKKSMEYWRADLERHLASQQVEMNRLEALKLFYPARGRGYMWAKDDRGKEYKIYISR